MVPFFYEDDETNMHLLFIDDNEWNYFVDIMNKAQIKAKKYKKAFDELKAHVYGNAT